MIKLTDILKEVKIVRPDNLQIILGDSFNLQEEIEDLALLVENKYLYYGTSFDSRDYNYINIPCGLELDEIELEITFNEPGFGGGYDEDEVNDIYAAFEEEINISSQVLPKYGTKITDEKYIIPLKNISNYKILFK